MRALSASCLVLPVVCATLQEAFPKAWELNFLCSCAERMYCPKRRRYLLWEESGLSAITEENGEAAGVYLKASALICQGMHAVELDSSVKSAQRFRS